MADFNEFINSLGDGIRGLADDVLEEFKDEAVSAGKDFLQTTETDLRRWTTLLANGELSPDDFKDLVLGKKDLAELHALTQAGLAKVRIERFRDGLVDLVIRTALDTFL